MKQQTFIVEFFAGSDCIDFERFSYKKAETVRKAIIDAIKKYLFFRLEWNKADKIVCFATPDGYNVGSEVWSMTHDELFSCII